jgi:hypothetical protein
MNTKSHLTSHCHIMGDHMLPSSVGGGAAVCTEIEQAVVSVAPNVAYTAEVTVLSPSRLAAALVVNGRPLPEQRFAITDRELNRGAIERFAHALAIEVAKAAKP